MIFFFKYYRESDALDHVAIVSVVIVGSDNKAKRVVVTNPVKKKQLAMMVAKRVAAIRMVVVKDANAFSAEISVNASRVMVKVETAKAMATRKMVKMVRMEMLVDHGIVALDHAIDQTKIEAVIRYVLSKYIMFRLNEH